MRRLLSLAAALAVSMLAIAPASPQQPPPVIGAKPASQGSRVGPALNAPRPAQPSNISADPGQRPQTANPIPSTGPARPQAIESAPRPVERVAPIVPADVRDVRGRRLPGAIRVSPNRAYDPVTGRYHQTLPAAPPR